MKSVSISGSLRKSVGRTDAKLNRRENKIPCVLYGGKEQFHFTVDEANFEKIITSPNVYVFNIDIEGTIHDAIVQEMQLHPVTDRIIHVDFLKVVPGKPVVVKIPVNTKGASEGVLKGGVLIKKIKKITLKALPEVLPDSVVLDITKLDIGDSIRVQDVKLDNIQILEIPSAVVVGVRTARAVVETVEGAAPVEGAVPAEGAAPAAGTPAAGAAPVAAKAADKAAPKGKEAKK